MASAISHRARTSPTSSMEAPSHGTGSSLLRFASDNIHNLDDAVAAVLRLGADQIEPGPVRNESWSSAFSSSLTLSPFTSFTSLHFSLNLCAPVSSEIRLPSPVISYKTLDWTCTGTKSKSSKIRRQCEHGHDVVDSFLLHSGFGYLSDAHTDSELPEVPEFS